MTARLDAPVLALVDGSPSAANAAWRAGLVARDHGLALRLLHDGAAGGEGPHDAPQLAAAMRERLGLAIETVAFAGDALAAIVDASRAASLLVLGSRRRNLLREFVLGTQAERLLRLCRLPVLVVKRHAMRGYRRVLVPVDLGPDAARVIAMAGLFSRDPGMEVMHALNDRHETSLRVAEVAEVVLRRQRNRAVQHAQSLLQEWLRGAGIPAQGAQPAVTFGDPAAAVLARERVIRADLVVMGKRRRGPLADFFLGGVTQRVLAAARADVLALPVEGQGLQRLAAREWLAVEPRQAG